MSNNIKNSKENIEHHYAIGNDFYIGFQPLRLSYIGNS